MNNLIKFIGVELIAIQMLWSSILMINELDYLNLFNMKIHIKTLSTILALGTSLCVIYCIDNFKL